MTIFVNRRELEAVRFFFPDKLPPDVILLPDYYIPPLDIPVHPVTIARMGVPSSWSTVRTVIERGWRT